MKELDTRISNTRERSGSLGECSASFQDSVLEGEAVKENGEERRFLGNSGRRYATRFALKLSPRTGGQVFHGPRCRQHGRRSHYSAPRRHYILYLTKLRWL
ncbi:uncharacterized protein LOC143218299 [Lasioglossum baleicum]|uniref:uncharacterized protein LOC143218299 n=1 Tax=Lasioglossum baleicum TaxID=434251 RepID=UPI003FCED610